MGFIQGEFLLVLEVMSFLLIPLHSDAEPALEIEVRACKE